MAAFVPGIDLAIAGMGKRSHPRDPGVTDIQPPGTIRVARSVGLHENRVAVCEPNRTRVVKSANSAKGAESMIERAVFLHQDHDVFGIEVSRAGCRLDRAGPLDRFGNQAGNAGDAGGDCGELEEIASGLHSLVFLTAVPDPQGKLVAETLFHWRS